ncbi:MAG: YihA family ribosome biogenesis GTP-binding protein [Clostridia bacterium]|nr:YihA family ribosome biogenesis GTP-binding protein [Clostridia bacterium]
MKITSASFIKSVSDTALPEYNKEIAVVGRSNVGKSSFINFLTDNGKLARTSSTPGRTRLINYFDVNKGEFTLVDLPGYGFAKVSNDEKEKWKKIIENYLQNSKNLLHVFIITDIKVVDSPLDSQMVYYLNTYNIPYTVIANKADNIPKSQIPKNVNKIAAHFGLGMGNIYVVSSVKKTGKEKVLDRIEQILYTPNNFE